MTANHDLIVLGAGSAGLATVLRAAQHGARVALLDPAPPGGTCVHRGCVPKKALWFAAQWAQTQRLAQAIGFAGAPGTLDWAHFRSLRARHIDAIAGRYAQRLQQAGVQRLAYSGRFIAADTIELDDGTRLQAPQIVIATGARPWRLVLPGFELGMLSDDMFALTARPQRVAILGGCYVAVEFAGMLQALGSEVELLARGALLESFDQELVQALTQQMAAHGVRITGNSAIRAARRGAGGRTASGGSPVRRPAGRAAGLPQHPQRGIRRAAAGHGRADRGAGARNPWR